MVARSAVRKKPAVAKKPAVVKKKPAAGKNAAMKVCHVDGQCPSGHPLVDRTDHAGGNCDECGSQLRADEHVMDCGRCSWCLCDRCSGFKAVATKGKVKGKVLEYNDFEKFMKPHWLTIGDVEKMKPGETWKGVYVLDRNLGDMCFKKNTEGADKAKDPERFLKSCTRANITNKRTPEQTKARKFWLGLKFNMDGSMEDSGPNFPFEALGSKMWSGKDLEKRWSKLPKSTPVGCRGPMLLASKLKLKGLPKVYWKSDYPDMMQMLLAMNGLI